MAAEQRVAPFLIGLLTVCSQGSCLAVSARFCRRSFSAFREAKRLFMKVQKMSFDKIPFSVPSDGSKVYKDECMYCFNSPFSEGGLYICLVTHYGLCPKHLNLHVKKTDFVGYLHFCRVPISPAPQPLQPLAKAGEIKGAGNCGYPLEKPQEPAPQYKDIWELAVFPDLFPYSLHDPSVPADLANCCQKLIEFRGAYNIIETESHTNMWEGNPLKPTKITNLHQIDDPPLVSTVNQHCQWEGCDKKDNLWMNLTDGSVFCGRRFWDGSGGRGHAIEYYGKTGYPLAVKLGTISANGADVYSYDEDEMVLDPDLEKHLAHFGIVMKEMKKTEMSMVEMEIDLSQRWEYSTIQEEGQKLVPMYGPGYTGMINLGNTCYMNAALQTLVLVPALNEIYAKHADAIFDQCSCCPVDDFNVQMAKVVCGLQSGDYSSKPLDDTSKGQGIRPFSFWSNVTRGNAEFSSKRQQDVEEFMLYLFEKLEMNHSVLKAMSSDDPVTAWRFRVEERTCCTVSGIVSYKTRPDTILSVPVVKSEAINLEEHRIYQSHCDSEKAAGRTVPPEQVIRLKVPLLACVRAFTEPEFITESRSPFTNENTVLQKEYHFATFPDWLWIHVKKYTISENMRAEKLDVTLDVPDELDLSALAAKGPQPGENVYTSADDSMKNFEASSEALGQLMEMGFNELDSRKALFKAANDPSSAIQFLLSGDLSSSQVVPASAVDRQNDAESIRCNDGPGKYRLRGFISHMGSSVHSGHYVCHLLKDDRWVIFNDEKVALSEKPPKEMAHIFLYQRAADGVQVEHL